MESCTESEPLSFMKMAASEQFDAIFRPLFLAIHFNQGLRYYLSFDRHLLILRQLHQPLQLSFLIHLRQKKLHILAQAHHQVKRLTKSTFYHQ